MTGRAPEPARPPVSSQAGLASIRPVPYPGSVKLPGERIPRGYPIPCTDAPALEVES